MSISIIVAQANNRVIGNANDLPWHLPDDLKHFKKVTSGHAVIMGRKTLESIVARIGKPLPGRRNIVLTRDTSYKVDGVETATSPKEALKLLDNDDEAFVIGGASIYEAFLPFAEKIYLTQVNATVDGDTSFPVLEDSEWKILKKEAHAADESHNYGFMFLELVRKQKPDDIIRENYD